MATITQLLAWGKETLSAHDNALLESQVLLSHVLACDRSSLYAWSEKDISFELQKQFETFVYRRQRNEPLAYIIEQKEFWSLPFKVTTDTLIPRWDTELLVEKILELLPVDALDIVDLGTGSGVIACALASERPHWRIYAVDISEDALKIAKKNASHLNLQNITFVHSDWLNGLQGLQFDALIGNPPYIREGDLHLTRGDLVFEPSVALTPGPSGLEAFKKILAFCPTFLKPKGLVAFEHGFDQGQAVQQLLKDAGFQEINTYVDHSGNERVTIGYYR